MRKHHGHYLGQGAVHRGLYPLIQVMVLDSNTGFTSMKHSHLYKNNSSWKNYYPSLRVMDSNFVITGVDSATVYQVCAPVY